MLKDVYENYNIEGNLEKIKSCPFCGGYFIASIGEVSSDTLKEYIRKTT